MLTNLLCLSPGDCDCDSDSDSFQDKTRALRRDVPPEQDQVLIETHSLYLPRATPKNTSAAICGRGFVGTLHMLPQHFGRRKSKKPFAYIRALVSRRVDYAFLAR
jgi:hypothetical protein